MTDYKQYTSFSALFNAIKVGDKVRFSQKNLNGIVFQIHPSARLIVLNGFRSIVVQHEGDMITEFQLDDEAPFENFIYVLHRSRELTPEEKAVSWSLQQKHQTYLDEEKAKKEKKRYDELNSLFEAIHAEYIKTGSLTIEIEHQVPSLNVKEFNEFVKNNKPAYARFIEAQSTKNGSINCTVLFY